jgi:hypothetical protein
VASHGKRDGTTPVDETLVKELNRLRAAGNDLAEAAARISRDYDGVHRLRLAIAGWYTALANEFDRDAPIERSGE